MIASRGDGSHNHTKTIHCPSTNTHIEYLVEVSVVIIVALRSDKVNFAVVIDVKGYNVLNSIHTVQIVTSLVRLYNTVYFTLFVWPTRTINGMYIYMYVKLVFSRLDVCLTMTMQNELYCFISNHIMLPN